MASSWIANLLPFWILGIPFVVAIISCLRLPSQDKLAPPDRRRERHNIVRESHITAGDTAVSRG